MSFQFRADIIWDSVPLLQGVCSNLSVIFAVHLVWTGLLPGGIKFLLLKHSGKETLGFLRKYLNKWQPCEILLMEAPTVSVKLKLGTKESCPCT